MARLDGKICLITGGARGMGAAEARVFAAEGAKVWIADILDEQGETTAKEIGGVYRRFDVRDEESWQSLVAEITQSDGRVDVLVNNAGIFRTAKLQETELSDFKALMEVNCEGVFLGLKHVGKVMIGSGGGSIINISSVAGLSGVVNSFAYGTSKWAVRGMTKSAALEYARYGIRVNSIHPGFIDTEMMQQVGDNIRLERMLKTVPMRRPAAPDEVAKLALFLASDESSYSTGSEFIVDGGVTA